jgi:separase
MLEATRHKINNLDAGDDLVWSLMTPSGSPLRPARNSAPKRRFTEKWDSDDEDEEPEAADDGLSAYWNSIYARYQQLPMDVASLSSSQAERLPPNWVVISINLNEDKDTMFISRQQSGRQPLMFFLPLKGRRDSDEDNHLTLEDAISEMKEIVKLNDEGTRSAAGVDAHDKQARVRWWAGRAELDKRLRELLENIEFCWFGAFKVLSIMYPLRVDDDIYIPDNPRPASCSSSWYACALPRRSREGSQAWLKRSG